MSQVIGHIDQLGWVAGKAVLLFVVALVGFRVGERRTLAQLRPFDFVVSVALGAIIGRTATSNTTSFVTGAGALITLLIAHRIIAQSRLRWRVMRMADDRPEVLVLQDGLQGRGLTRAGLTEGDVYSILRQQGVGDLAEVDVLIFEAGGGISLHWAGTPRGPLMVHALRAAELSE
ncbi:MAG: YetF domain-containing protein [Allobranchiibius sp.]